MVRRRCPDFIVILPEIGILVIEVKGWRLSELARVDPQAVTMLRGGREGVEQHPGRQARGYMHRLMDECRRRPYADALLCAEGAHANRFGFPFCAITVLTQITRSQIEAASPELAAVFPAGSVVTRDELADWEELAPEALVAKLKARFDPWWPFPKLTPRQTDALRAVIHPEVVIRSGAADLAVLDLRQERNARAIGEGHRLVYGVAGSGKTVLLIARAKLLAEDAAKRILLLCYNRLLASHLAGALLGRRNVTVRTFHGWGVRNGAEFREGEEDEAFGERLLARMEQAYPDRGRFDAVLIDEAQDWPCSWFRCAKLALKEPETGDLLIVGDASQALYRSRPFTWKEAGIHAPGRTINKRFDLDRNYRNTAEILRAAQPFAAAPAADGAPAPTLLPIAVDPEKAMRSGPEPVLIKLNSPAEECHYAAALIEVWLRGGIDINGRRERLRPSDIAVLYPRERQDAAIELLCGRLNGFTRAVLLANRKRGGTLRDEAVRILPMRGTRGLQFRVVVLLWTDLLPSSFKGEAGGIDRSLLYVAMTRAEDLLVILHSGASAYVAELYGRLSQRLPA
jgi:hypothetical protein